VNGSNQYWQYQPPPQPPGGVYYPQPPRRRSTAKALWFVVAAFAVTIMVILVIIIHSSGHWIPASPPRDQASYQDGYDMGQDFAQRTVERYGAYETVDHGEHTATLGTLDVAAFCQDPELAAELPPNAEPGNGPANTADFLAGCAAAVHDLAQGK
jgi:hypothetical protein